MLGLEQGVKVRHTPRSWIVHVPVIRGKNVAEVYGLAMNLAIRVAEGLAKKYGVVLSQGDFVAGELAVEDPLANFFGRFFTVRTKERKVDHSWNVGELEHLSKDAVQDYLQMPQKIKDIESTMGLLAQNINKLAEAMGGGLGGIEDSKRLAEGQKKLGEYTV